MNTNNKSNAIAKIATIHQIEGFDPTELAVDYTDKDTSESRKRLPVMSQMAWFRLCYPEGKISVTAKPVNDYYVAHAKVYRNFSDPMDHFLAEATASRKYDQEKPSVSPREWAQTAAIGIALRNAGFGLQFHAAGDAFDHAAVDETSALVPESDSSAPDDNLTPVPQTETVQEVSEELSPEDAYKKALNTPCPISKFSGKTLGDLLRMGEVKVLNWVATKYTKDPAIAAAARLICEKALELADEPA